MLTETIIILFLILILYHYGNTKLPKNLPPGPLRFPGIGNLFQLAMTKMNTPYGAFHELSKKYGPIMFLQIGEAYQVVLEDYDLIKEVLSDEVWVDRYYSKYMANRSFGKILGVLMIGGRCWKVMRRFTVRTLREFGFGKKKSMEISLQDEITELTVRLEKQIYLDKGQTIVSMKQFFTISVLNVLWCMIAGYRFSHDDAKLRDLLDVVYRDQRLNAIGSLTSPIYLYTAFPFLYYIVTHFTTFDESRREDQEKIQNFISDILHERRAEGSYREEQRDYIDVFLREIDVHKNQPSETNLYTDEQFIVVTMDLFTAGSETISNTLEFAILFFIKNPQVQIKVQEEIDRIVGYDRVPCIADKSSMPYTEATILEVQRHANVVPITVRGPIQNTTLGGYNIPAGVAGIINLYSMHMNEKVWGDPLNFRPERFLNSQNQIVNADKILPFGIGRRVCIGEQLAKTSLFTHITAMLQKFTFEESPFHEEPIAEPSFGFTLTPQPYHATIKQRHGGLME